MLTFSFVFQFLPGTWELLVSEESRISLALWFNGCLALKKYKLNYLFKIRKILLNRIGVIVDLEVGKLWPKA